MFRMIPTSLALAVLMGCANEPAPMAPPEFYDFFGGNLAVLDKCSSAGYMSPQVAGKGAYVLKQELNKTRYRYWPNQIEQRRKGLGETYASKVSQASCDSVATSIEASYLELTRQQQIISQPSSAPTLTNTNCTTYFGNTHCTSY